MVIEQAYGGPKITKDGVTVAKAIEFKDKFQNVGASLVKQVASATNDVAGDGAQLAQVSKHMPYAPACLALVGFFQLYVGADVLLLLTCQAWAPKKSGWCTI